MNEQSEFESWPELGNSKLPDFGMMMAQRLASKVQSSGGDFDPHAMMIKKHKVETGEVPVNTTTEVQYPEEEIKALEDFCTKHGILGVNYGNRPPSVILALLRKQIGDYSDTPLEGRIPIGYQKKGTINQYSVNYPYQKPSDKRIVLNG